LKVKVIHDACGREVLVQQILDSQGHCPWDGLAFNNDYTAVLAEALEQTEVAGGMLENALEKIVGMNPAFTIDRASLLGEVENQLERLNDRRKRPHR
jgi:hypothetical protein